MARPTARVLALLEVLQSGGTRTASDLAERLGVDERTLRRYVEHLIDLDVPVEAVRGRYGGYRLSPGYRLPPLMLTDEEALAVLLGLLTGRRAGLVAGSVAALESAAAKVRRVLPTALAQRLDALLETVDFTAPALPGATPEAEVLLTLAEAARDRRPVTIGYAGRGERTLHPYGIVAHAGRWYVTGADSVSESTRTFRLDRITSVAVRPGEFEAPAGFDAAARLVAGFAAAPYRHRVSVLVEGPADEVRRRLPATVATVTEVPGAGRVRVRLQAERLDWVPSLLAGLNRPFTVEEPPELRDEVRALGRRLADYADRSSSPAAVGRKPPPAR